MIFQMKLFCKIGIKFHANYIFSKNFNVSFASA